MPRRSRFAAQFIDSHPVLTPRKIMNDRRLMLPGYGKLCVTSLYFNVPLCRRFKQVEFTRVIIEFADVIS